MPKPREVREVAGRAYWHEDEARVVVAAWRASGEGLVEFARRHGVDRRRVGRWAQRLAEPEPVRFHPVRVREEEASPAQGGAIEVDLPRGLRIRLPQGFEAEDLRRLLSVLDAGAPC